MVKSFYFKQVKKGQAAIEFLMTYGWMLLVVLIVGALIFSFVDFGSLLPNQLELSNNLRAETAVMVANAGDDIIQIPFTYVGPRATTIVINSSGVSGIDINATLVRDTNQQCRPLTIENRDNAASSDINSESFINGQLGIIRFLCEDTPGLTDGDVFQGEVTIPMLDARTGIVTVSRGSLRISVDQ